MSAVAIEEEDPNVAICHDCGWTMVCEDPQDVEDMLALHQVITLNMALKETEA